MMSADRSKKGEDRPTSFIASKFRSRRPFSAPGLQFSAPKRGFTLIELLAVVTIIGLLSTVGMVSYDSARRSSRDVKRVSDIKQLQQALEIYFEYHDGYPDDGVSGPDGLEIGTPETANFSDAGFAPATEGQIFMVNLPKNPQPGGAPYVYRSVHRDGTDCDYPPCDAYALYFSLEGRSGSLLPGPHALTPNGMVGPEGGSVAGVTGDFWGGLDDASAALGNFAGTSLSAWQDFAADPTVETVTEAAVAPAVTVAAAANFAVAIQSVVSTAAVGQYIIFFLTQPILLLTRKRRKHWGTVYNALSHLPEDLVIVRLRRGTSGRVIKSEVTDKEGRFSFIVPAGDYRLDAAKGGFEFPSQLTAGRSEDGAFLDVYHGEILEVGSEGGVLTPNVPVDPAGQEDADAVVLKHERWKRLRRTMAGLGPILGGFALVIKPSVVVGILLVLQVVIYGLFRRVAVPARPKNWGVVFDDDNRRPVAQAVVRVFALPYHKLMETYVTDARGRYNFRVGKGKYYLTVTKTGYLKTESEPLNFAKAEGAMFIAADIPVRRSGAVPVESAKPVSPSAAPSVRPLPVAHPVLGDLPRAGTVAPAPVIPPAPPPASAPVEPAAPPPPPVQPQQQPATPAPPAEDVSPREIQVEFRQPDRPAGSDRELPPASFVA